MASYKVGMQDRGSKPRISTKGFPFSRV